MGGYFSVCEVGSLPLAFEAGLSTSGIMMLVPGRLGSPPLICIVIPAVTSWVVCARRGLSKGAAFLAASIRTDIGNCSHRYVACRNSTALMSFRLYSRWGPGSPGGRTSPSMGLGIQHTSPPDNEGCQRSRRGPEHCVY